MVKETPPTAIPVTSLPAVRCIHDALKANAIILSSTLYSVDEARIAVKIVFGTKRMSAIAYQEFFLGGDDGVLTETDRYPREGDGAVEAQWDGIERQSRLIARCHITQAMDNVIPEAPPLAEWRELAWPKS